MNQPLGTALTINNLWWRYPTFGAKTNPWTLRDINLQVEQGECFGITGPSGAGKTTLCRAILGAIPFSSRLTATQLPHHWRGSITVFGEAVTARTPIDQRVGMVLQDPENQFLRMSLLHELSFGLQLQHLPHDEILQRTHEALSAVGLAHLWPGAIYRHPAELSGGQKQRIAIAAFLAMRPQLLILDEPTSDLDPPGKHAIIETLTSLRQQYSMTIILVEQDPDILSTFCDRIALLDQGRIELIASPASFYAHQPLLTRSGASISEFTRISWATSCTFQSRPPLTIQEAAIAFANVEKSRRGGGGADVGWGSLWPPAAKDENTPIITAQNIYYHYDNGTPALQGVDLSVSRGEILALLGPNGSGKTTFAKILAGIYRPSRGTVHIMGQNLASRRMRTHLSSQVGYVFQNPDHQLFTRKVSDEVDYGLRNLGLNATQRHKAVASALEAVGLSFYADEDPLFLGKGQRQRLAVAAILAMQPEILIVDEPTTGQDYRMVREILMLLHQLHQQGKTILIITHDMTLVAELCQRVVTFQHGKVAFTGTPAQLFDSPATLQEVGLQPPPSAALSTHMRSRYPDLPFLYTVEQWVEALST